MISVKHILLWYSQNARPLPWRKEYISAYEVWVSEIMLQQTQVSRVVLYYERFLKKFPTVQKLARATWEDFLPYYEGLGYYARGRNMLKTAEIIARDFGGEFPRDKTLLMKLPGIGEYTASAILSFAFGEPEVAFDTNFKKIFGTREAAGRALRRSGVSSVIFNSAVMDYASAHRLPVVISESTTRRGFLVKPGMTTTLTPTIVLHENHQKYFSENKEKYKPFTTPKNINSRADIKKYFLEKYGLRVSVRPPDKQGTVNVQILSGRHRFAIFDKKSYDKWRTEYKYIV